MMAAKQVEILTWLPSAPMAESSLSLQTQRISCRTILARFPRPSSEILVRAFRPDARPGHFDCRSHWMAQPPTINLKLVQSAPMAPTSCSHHWRAILALATAIRCSMSSWREPDYLNPQLVLLRDKRREHHEQANLVLHSRSDHSSGRLRSGDGSAAGYNEEAASDHARSQRCGVGHHQATASSWRDAQPCLGYQPRRIGKTSHGLRAQLPENLFHFRNQPPAGGKRHHRFQGEWRNGGVKSAQGAAPVVVAFRCGNFRRHGQCARDVSGTARQRLPDHRDAHARQRLRGWNAVLAETLGSAGWRCCISENAGTGN